tara:strand:- start:2425 stop:3531 length:1107 start_codon:yes stop_codon:yes gene_type:complete
MTTFFNKKEDVIDLQLTPFGESLMSIGQLKPVYYAFFDDDILYDASGSAGIAEVQNDAELRIQENTLNIKSQAVYSGIESNLSPLIASSRFGEAWESGLFRFAYAHRDETGYDFSAHEIQAGTYNAVPPNIDQNFTFVEPLGTMELGSQNAPAWNVRVLNGELTGAINYLTSSTSAGIYSNVRRIPQLDFDITYRVLVGNTTDLNPYGDLARDARVISQVYEDGTFLYLSKKPPNLILVVDEENTPVDLEYDMEVFLVEPGASADDADVLTPKRFLKPRVQVVGDVLLDEEILPQNTLLDSSFAEYFFLVNTDREIPSEDICPVLGDVEVRGITLNDIPYDCKDVRRFGRFDIYGTNAVEEDPCDDED